MDSHAQSYETRISRDESKQRTLRGSLCTILLAIVLTIYSYRKVNILINREEEDTTQHVSEYEINERETFSFKNGFNVAVALTSYSSETEMELDPSYGRLRFIKSIWGVNENGTIFWDKKEARSRLCT